MSPADRKADRHKIAERLGKQVPISARLDREDYDPFEAAFKATGLNRRQAIIAAIRDWARKHAPETTQTTEEH